MENNPNNQEKEDSGPKYYLDEPVNGDKDQNPKNNLNGVEKEEKNVIPRIIEQEMKASYLDYAMSVIVSRALPDVRDGLKPVHRRILFAMNELGMFHSKPFKKSARIVGETMGKFHPHGDVAIYDSLVRMAQPFSLRYPLIQGQGNFGNIDGDPPAAMRYCITGDSLILTDKGILPIRALSNKQEEKISLKILSCVGKKNRASKFFDSGKHKVIELKTKLGYSIKGSYNHPVLCWTLNKGIPSIEWRLLENVNKQDAVIINRNFSLFSKKDIRLDKFRPRLNKKNKPIKLPEVMNKELAFLLGALVSEGSFHQNKILFCNSDTNFYNCVKEIIYGQFKGVQLYERKIIGNCLELTIYHNQIVEFLKNIGLNEARSDKKSIPFSVLLSSKNSIIEFLKGLFEGDGSVVYKVDKRHGGRSIELTYNSKSNSLIQQLKILLLNFGIVTTKPYRDKRNNCYKLIISGYSSIKKFKDEIGFYSDRKINALQRIDSINRYRMSKTDFIPHLSVYFRNKYKTQFLIKNNFDRYSNLEKNLRKLMRILDDYDKKIVRFILRNRYLFETVETVQKLARPEKVYSVRVESRCHSFVANGFINHNTEARLNKPADEMLEDIKKATVEFQPNFDGTLEEPVVLPAKLPNLLLNGTSGIAVGMATNIPPHNMREVVSAIIKTIDNPDITINELIKIVRGPDFPTGAIIQGTSGILEAYKTGRGKVHVKAVMEVEESHNKEIIVVKEIPYQIDKSLLIEQIVEVVNSKKIVGIGNIRDESDRSGMRIVIELKRDTNSEVVLNQLFKFTRLSTTFGINMLALVNNEPKTLGLKEIIGYYINHRVDVVTRRAKFDLDKAEKRAHILEGIIICLNNIDPVIKTIKASKTVEAACDSLVAGFSLTKIQAQAILEMRLQRLTSLEQEKIKTEHKDILSLIEKLKEVLASKQKVFDIIKQELNDINEKYGDERRTKILESEVEVLAEEDFIEEEDMIVTVTHAGYIKRLPINTYKQQRRGGKGVIATATKEEDFLEHLFIANTHSSILFFTNTGKVHWLKVYEIPLASRLARGKAIANLLNLGKDEEITAFVPVKEFDDKHYLVMATKKGIVKKTNLMAYSRPRSTGIIAITLEQDDSLINVKMTDGNTQLIMATKNGMAVKFHENGVRPIGRSGRGVRGVTLRSGDEVIGMESAEDSKTLLTITENGYGKRTTISEYRLINRGGIGVINIQCSERNGKVVAISSVTEEDELIFISKQGIIIRTPAKGVSVIGRNTQGVRLMSLESGDKIIAAAKVIND